MAHVPVSIRVEKIHGRVELLIGQGERFPRCGTVCGVTRHGARDSSDTQNGGLEAHRRRRAFVGLSFRGSLVHDSAMKRVFGVPAGASAGSGGSLVELTRLTHRCANH